MPSSMATRASPAALAPAEQAVVDLFKEMAEEHVTDDELDKAKEWERKAMVAVRAGDDNLARQALEESGYFREVYLYTARGSRTGYRDVLEKFTITPGGVDSPITIACREPIN